VTVIDSRPTQSGIRLNVGCGLSPTPGWLNFDNSPSVRVAGWPVLSSVLAGLGFLGGASARLGAMTQSLARMLSEAGFDDAAVTAPGSTRIHEPGRLDLRERAAESVYVEAIRPR
jgi:hypothetical protein